MTLEHISRSSTKTKTARAVWFIRYFFVIFMALPVNGSPKNTRIKPSRDSHKKQNSARSISSMECWSEVLYFASVDIAWPSQSPAFRHLHFGGSLCTLGYKGTVCYIDRAKNGVVFSCLLTWLRIVLNSLTWFCDFCAIRADVACCVVRLKKCDCWLPFNTKVCYRMSHGAKGSENTVYVWDDTTEASSKC